MPNPVKNLREGPIAPPKATCIVVVSMSLQCAAGEGLSTITPLAQLLKIF